ALAPYLAVVLALTLVIAHTYSLRASINGSAFAAGAALICLAIFRPVFTLIENQQLTVQLRSFNENLEQIVVRRTQQLSALQQLTKAVNGTRQLDQVLLAAGLHTRQALQADAVVLWLAQQETPGR